jgi:hypothetical protein
MAPRERINNVLELQQQSGEDEVQVIVPGKHVLFSQTKYQQDGAT